jgi:hypothetical protein
MAGVSDLSKLFGKGGIGEQLVVFGVLQQLLGAVLGPELEMLTRFVNDKLQATPLTPADLADMVVRHIVSAPLGEAYAKQSGVAPSDFARMVESAGEGPAPGDLAEALRRGLIPETGTGPDSTSFEQGIAESHLRDKWRATLKGLSVKEPSPADALDALLEGQLPLERARELYGRFGGDLEHFQWLFDTKGSAPTPLEAAQMANRNLIPWEGEGPDVVSFHQAFLEGPWRNKWEAPYRRLAEYHPPPRTVTALVRSGAITDAQAVDLFKQEGLSQELATAMLHDAHKQKLAAAHELAKAEVDTLYHDQIVSADQADAMYMALGWTKEEAAFHRAVQDMRRTVAALNQAIGRVHNLYVARKITKQSASGVLDALHVPSAQRDSLFGDWDIERGANVKVLSAAEIASAFFYKVIDQGTAVTELVDDGYTEVDAWILLSVRQHGPLPNPPAGIVVPPQNA